MAVVFQLVERYLEQGEVGWFAAVVIYISLIVFSHASVISAVCIRFLHCSLQIRMPPKTRRQIAASLNYRKRKGVRVEGESTSGEVRVEDESTSGEARVEG